MLAVDKDESTWPNEGSVWPAQGGQGSAWPAQGGQGVGLLHSNTHSQILQHAYPPPYSASTAVSAGKAAGVAGVAGVVSGDGGGP